MKRFLLFFFIIFYGCKTENSVPISVLKDGNAIMQEHCISVGTKPRYGLVNIHIEECNYDYILEYYVYQYYDEDKIDNVVIFINKNGRYEVSRMVDDEDVFLKYLKTQVFD